jgi:magnesium transporter
MPTHAQSPTRSNSDQQAHGQVQATRQLVVCRADGHFRSTVDPEDISEIIKGKDQFVWLDIQDPQDEDIALLREEFKFHPLAIEDATRHHERPKVDSYDGYYFLVFYAITYDK